MSMTNQYKYEKVGVNWIGIKPSHWSIFPGKACFEAHQEKNTGLKERGVLSLSYGRIKTKSTEQLHGLVPESFETYQVIEPGDIICRPTDLQNDQNSLRFGISPYRGIITSAYINLRTKPFLSSEYGYLLLHAYDLMKVFYGLGSGLRQNLDWKDFKYLPCLIPPFEEQEGIVNFLNYLEKKVGRFVNTKRKQIALLKVQKQALIDHAVIDGLNSDVRLKPSNVKWLREVPTHWEVRRLRNCVQLIVGNVDKNITEGETPVRLCNYVDVYKNEAIEDSLNFMNATATESEIRDFAIKIGDVIITKDSEMWNDIGVPAIVKYEASDLICGYHLAILRPDQTILSGEYLLRLMQSQGVSIQLQLSANGVTRYGISHGAIKSIVLPIPPLEEQKKILAFLDKALKPFSKNISKYNSQIEKILEYKTALVSNVVTGKLDVRSAVINLTEEIDQKEVVADVEDSFDQDEEAEAEEISA